MSEKLSTAEYQFCMHKKDMSGSFIDSLIKTMYKADLENMNNLAKGYPELTKVVLRYQNEKNYWLNLMERWNEEYPHHPFTI